MCFDYVFLITDFTINVWVYKTNRNSGRVNIQDFFNENQERIPVFFPNLKIKGRNDFN
jgi:hypothetical protein